LKLTLHRFTATKYWRFFWINYCDTHLTKQLRS